MTDRNQPNFILQPAPAAEKPRSGKAQEAPPRKGEPEQVENVPGREERNDDRSSVPGETRRAGRQDRDGS